MGIGNHITFNQTGLKESFTLARKIVVAAPLVDPKDVLKR